MSISKKIDERMGTTAKVKEDRTKEWDDSEGTPRKYIYATGSIAGGKNKIHIDTINGSVYLKKGK